MAHPRRLDRAPRGPLAVFLASPALAAVTAFAGCGGHGAGDATPIPSTGVPVAAVGARGVDTIATTSPPVVPIDPHGSPFGSPLGTGTSPQPAAPPPDPFAPPVAPPVIPPSPTSTGVPL